MIGIYKILNTVNNKIYIGQSVHIEKRYKEHIRESKYERSNMPIHKAIHKYGSENFQLEILEECSIEDLDCRECYYIDKYNSRNREVGYNILEGGNKGPTLKGVENGYSVLTEEIVSKIRYLYLEGYVRKQVYAKINEIFPININTFYDVWNGKTYKDICYYVYDDMYKDSIKEFRGINKSKLKDTPAKKYVQEIRNAKASGQKIREYYNLNFKDKINYNTFQDIWYGKTYSYITPTVEDITVEKKCKKDYSVSQYTKEGGFIKNFDTIKSAIIEIKGQYDPNAVGNIYENCIGKRKSAWGYIWKFNNCNDQD